jgi:hypothetical protein
MTIDSQRRFRWPRFALVATAVVTLIGASAFYIVKVRPLGLYRDKNDDIRTLITTFESRTPSGVSEPAWRNLVTLTNIGFGNVFFSPSHATYDELLRFEDDLRRETGPGQPMTIETCQWIWDRLGDTGSKGKAYIEQMRPLFDEAAAAARQSIGEQSASLNIK